MLLDIQIFKESERKNLNLIKPPFSQFLCHLDVHFDSDISSIMFRFIITISWRSEKNENFFILMPSSKAENMRVEISKVQI